MFVPNQNMSLRQFVGRVVDTSFSIVIAIVEVVHLKPKISVPNRTIPVTEFYSKFVDSVVDTSFPIMIAFAGRSELEVVLLIKDTNYES